MNLGPLLGRMTLKNLAWRVVHFPISPGVTKLLFGASIRTISYSTFPSRILVVRLDEIGDVVLTTPFLRELRRNFPKADITLIVKKGVENLVDVCPYVDRVFSCECKGRGILRRYVQYFRAYNLAVKGLKQTVFDLSVNPRWDTDDSCATYLAYFSGAGRRVGFSETVNAGKLIWNKGYDSLLTEAVSTKGGLHEVKRTLSLISSLGGEVATEFLELWVTEDDLRVARKLLPKGWKGIMVAFAPGASDLNKRWPVERFLEVAKHLVSNWYAHIVVVGSRGDSVLGRFLMQHLPDGSCTDLTDATTLRQTAAVLQACTLLVSNDTGPKHMAAAMGVSVIEVMSLPKTGDPLDSHSPLRFHAWGVPNTVLQPSEARPPCKGNCQRRHAHCILGVSIEDVTEAVDHMLQASRSGGAGAKRRESV